MLTAKLTPRQPAGLVLRNHLLHLAPIPQAPYRVCLLFLHPLTAPPTSSREQMGPSDAY